MLTRLATPLLLCAMLTGTSQAFTISLSGTMDLIGPAAAGDPAGYLGPGTYAYSAIIRSEPANPLNANPTFITEATLDLSTAGLGTIVFGGGTVSVTAPDTVVANPTGGPNGSTMTFTFVNPNNPVGASIPSNDNVRLIINDPAVAITGVGDLFPGVGAPGTTTIGSSVTTSAVVAAPEPSSFAVLAALSVGGGIFYRRRKAKVA